MEGCLRAILAASPKLKDICKVGAMLSHSFFDLE